MFTDEEKRVLQQIDARRNEVVGLLRELLRFKTVTPLTGEKADGDDYRRHQAFVSKYLEELGFGVETWDADAASLPVFPGSGVMSDRDLSNMPIVVGRREGRGRSLLLNGHYDVVPPGVLENWTVPPFEGVVADGKVFGRGACDMKGGLAAALEALRCIANAKVDVPGGLVFESVPDEEQSSMGTLACCQRGIRADAGLIPEPTDLQVLVATRGSYAGVISVFGRAGHSEETPKPWEQGGAVNAITKAAKVVRALEALNEDWGKRPEKHHKYLDPDIIVPTMIRGGEWEVMYPERVDITFTSDFVPATKDIHGEIQAALDRVASEDSWMREHPPVLQPPESDYLYASEVREDEPIVKTASAALADLGVAPKLVGCGSLTDMVHLVNYSKVPTVSVGPSARTAHRPDEHVSIDELVAATKAIALVILRWTGEPASGLS